MPGLGKPGWIEIENRTSGYINTLRGNYQATNHILVSDFKKVYIQIIKMAPSVIFDDVEPPVVIGPAT